MTAFLPKPVGLSDLFAALRPGVTEPPRQTDGLDELLGRLRQEFIRSCPRLRRELEASWQSREWQALARQAHQLKGSADLLGLIDLAIACAALYAAAETRSEGEARDALARVMRPLVELAAPEASIPAENLSS